MTTRLLSEDELDEMPAPNTGGGGSSASIEIGSHLPNPLSPALNTPPPSGVGNIIQPIEKVPSGGLVGTGGNEAVPSTAGGAHDRINNVTQKEEAMALSGVTRRKTYEVIRRLLDARKWAEVTDKQGNVKWEWVDDLEKQRQGAEMALKVMGDMIEHKQVEYGIADSTLEKLKALSVAELKGRAAAILEGKGKAVDAVVVK